MQIVIDIDENLYTRLFSKGNYDAVDMLNVCSCVKKGTPLPKGHGDLIDREDLLEWVEEIPTKQYYIYEMVRVENIDAAPTIIEADKEDKECQE